MSRPACEDCAQPADYTVIDYGRGYQASPLAPQPYLPICTPCLDQRRADEAGDPWPLWADPKILTDWTTKEHDMTADLPTIEPDVLADKLAPLASRYLDLTEQKDRIEAELEEIKAAIRDLTPGPDTYCAGEHTVIVAANRRFDEKRALQLVGTGTPLSDLVTVPTTKVDKDKLRALAPDIFEAAQVLYSERVSVKP